MKSLHHEVGQVAEQQLLLAQGVLHKQPRQRMLSLCLGEEVQVEVNAFSLLYLSQVVVGETVNQEVFEFLLFNSDHETHGRVTKAVQSEGHRLGLF